MTQPYSKPISLLAATMLLALPGCLGDKVVMASQFSTNGDIEARNRTVETFRLGVPARIELEVYTRVGEIGVTLMEASESQFFLRGEPVKSLWHSWYDPNEDHSTDHDAKLAAGTYSIGLSCVRKEPCKYRLDVQSEAPADKLQTT